MQTRRRIHPEAATENADRASWIKRRFFSQPEFHTVIYSVR